MKNTMVTVFLLLALFPPQGKRPLAVPGDTPAERANYLKSILMPTGMTSASVV
jgi:hypothetical protein